jgi:hypothetical protein
VQAQPVLKTVIYTEGGLKMPSSVLEKLGGASLMAGSLLFAAYSALFVFLLPIGSGTSDFVQVVLDPDWSRLALIAFVGILAMLIGFHAVYSRIRSNGGMLGASGFLLIQMAFLFQACKVTWELLLYPVIASHPESAFLLRDALIKTNPAVVGFRVISGATIFAGVVFFCLALYRSDTYPKPAAILIFIGALVYAVGPLISVFVSIGGIFALSVGCLLLGTSLLKAQRT